MIFYFFSSCVDMDYSTIIIFIILFLLSGFFSGTEIALMSLPKHKIDFFLKKKLSWAQYLAYIKGHSDRLLITILIWNNLVNTFTAAFATTIAIWLAKNSWLWVDQSTAVWIATWIITFLLLLFGEIIPKSFATKNAEKISLMVAWFYRILMILLYPIIVFIEFITKLFTWKQKLNKVSEEEIESFIDMWREAWALEHEEHEYLKNILELQDTTAEHIMTPRVKIEKLSTKTIIKQAKDYIINHTHSRIPVYKWDIDNIVWIVNIRLLLSEIEKWNENKTLEQIKLIEPIKVPLNMPIDWLLKTFQKTHQHMGIVIDEYGGVAWLVTLEDVIEEVFGEIQDETDKEELSVKKISNNEYIIDSTISFGKILELLNISYDDLSFEYENYINETVSYFITDYLERFPYPDESISINLKNNKKLKIKVLQLENQTIWKIQIKLEKK